MLTLLHHEWNWSEVSSCSLICSYSGLKWKWSEACVVHEVSRYSLQVEDKPVELQSSIQVHNYDMNMNHQILGSQWCSLHNNHSDSDFHLSANHMPPAASASKPSNWYTTTRISLLASVSRSNNNVSMCLSRHMYVNMSNPKYPVL